MVSRPDFRAGDHVAIERADGGGHIFLDIESIARAAGYVRRRPRLIVVVAPLLAALVVLAWGRR